MKEFNLDAALNGEPVMLRNGKRLTLVIKRLITMFLILLGCGKSQRLVLKIYLSRFIQKWGNGFIM